MPKTTTPDKVLSLRLPADLYAQLLRRENAEAARAVRRANVTGAIIRAIRAAIERPIE